MQQGTDYQVVNSNFFKKFLDQWCWRFSERYPNNFSTELSSQIFDCCPRNFLIQEERIGNVVSTSHWIRPVVQIWCAIHVNLLLLIHYDFYRPQTKFAKIMFSQVSVCPQWGGGHAWQRGVHGREDMHGEGVCMAGGGACMAGGMCGRGTCMACMPPCRYYKIWSMSGRYVSYWNAFLLAHVACTISAPQILHYFFICVAKEIPQTPQKIESANSGEKTLFAPLT